MTFETATYVSILISRVHERLSVLAILTFFSESHVGEKLHMDNETFNISTCIIYLPFIVWKCVDWMLLCLWKQKLRLIIAPYCFRKDKEQ